MVIVSAISRPTFDVYDYTHTRQHTHHWFDACKKITCTTSICITLCKSRFLLFQIDILVNEKNQMEYLELSTSNEVFTEAATGGVL